MEMLSSKILLEKKLKHSVDHFAYPYGTENEATQREFEMITECGFHTAVTTRLERLERPNLNRIPRTGVPPFLSLQGFKGKISGLERIAR
jgi:peptidoglycan/xylan/chitin deacetylase (PgdA/CDA1 family)